MNWEELSSDDFPRAVRDAQGVCVVPLSVIERHGHHLPTGTDMFIGRELCRRAAALEPVVVFPDLIYTQILFLRYFAQTQLASARDYAVYVTDPVFSAETDAELAVQWKTKIDGHAGEHETSEILAIRPDLVHLDRAPVDGEGLPLGRLKALNEAGVYTGIWCMVIIRRIIAAMAGRPRPRKVIDCWMLMRRPLPG